MRSSTALRYCYYPRRPAASSSEGGKRSPQYWETWGSNKDSKGQPSRLCLFVSKAFPSMGFLIPCLWRYVHRGQLRVLSTFPPVSGVWHSENSKEWGKQLERIKTHLQDAACGAFLPSLSPKCRESAVWLITPERKAEALKLKYFGNHVYRG